MKKLQLFLAAAVLAFACASKAQVLTGSINASVISGQTGNATSSSLKLFETNIISTTTGDFVSTVPTGSLAETFFSPPTISGLSSTPISISINNYIFFSVPASPGGSGTSPLDRFDFDLATMAEDSFNSTTGAATFTGTGTLVDNADAFTSSPADITITFSNAHTYTFTITTVPEPATITLAAVGLLGAWAIRRRKI